MVHDEEEFEVEDILDVKKGRGGQLQARVQWVGWSADPAWYPLDNFRNNADILTDFYRRHPSKPRPDWLPIEASDTPAHVNTILNETHNDAPVALVPALPKPPGTIRLGITEANALTL